jgi:hypothetical protein
MSTNNKLLVSDISFFEEDSNLELDYYNLASCDIALSLKYSTSPVESEKISIYIYSSLTGKALGIDINKKDGRIDHINSIDNIPKIIKSNFNFPKTFIHAFPKIVRNKFLVDSKYKDIGIYDIYQECNITIYDNAISYIFNPTEESFFSLMPTPEILFNISAERELISVTSQIHDRKVLAHLFVDR